MASESHYGLSLVLGGGEVTAQELAKLYALLANRGELRPLRMQLNETESTPVRLLSEEASFITLDMLRQHRRPGDTLAQRSSSLPVYWKTGTSRAFATPGASGFSALTCWWCGKATSTGAATMRWSAPRRPRRCSSISSTASTPATQACGNRSTRSPTAAAGGHLPRQRRSADAVVPAEGQDRFIPGKSPIKVDSVYRPVVLDIHSGEVVCPPYDAAQTRTEIFEFWPSDLANVFARPGCRSRRRRSTAARTTASPSAATRRASLRH